MDHPNANAAFPMKARKLRRLMRPPSSQSRPILSEAALFQRRLPQSGFFVIVKGRAGSEFARHPQTFRKPDLDLKFSVLALTGATFNVASALGADRYYSPLFNLGVSLSAGRRFLYGLASMTDDEPHVDPP